MLIPYEHWRPLTLPQVTALFHNAPFAWALAGGYCIEQFVGRRFREHADIDVIVFRDQQLALQSWLTDWHLYAADPPGTLRPWLTDESLPTGVHDIWGHKPDSTAWQLQLMLAEGDDNKWFFRRDHSIGGRRNDLIVQYNGLPCVRIEVQLLYKSRGRRDKDELDFRTCLPLLEPNAVQWLRQSIQHCYPDGHPWLAALLAMENKQSRT